MSSICFLSRFLPTPVETMTFRMRGACIGSCSRSLGERLEGGLLALFGNHHNYLSILATFETWIGRGALDDAADWPPCGGSLWRFAMSATPSTTTLSSFGSARSDRRRSCPCPYP
jgi:hypothetical protein